MAIMLITHNLGVVAEICEQVIVMYLGEVVERAPVDALFHDALHPYTQALLRSIPVLGRASWAGSIRSQAWCPIHTIARWAALFTHAAPSESLASATRLRFR